MVEIGELIAWKPYSALPADHHLSVVLVKRELPEGGTVSDLRLSPVSPRPGDRVDDRVAPTFIAETFSRGQRLVIELCVRWGQERRQLERECEEKECSCLFAEKWRNRCLRKVRRTAILELTEELLDTFEVPTGRRPA